MQRKKFDLKAPNARAIRDGIVHGAFLTQGAITAFPLCFPGVTTPIPHDESRITALTVTPDGVVYGGTSGHHAHCFVAMFHGATGFVFDLGTVDAGTDCTAICCTRGKVVVAVQSEQGAELVRLPLQPLPFDLLQEWGFTRPNQERVVLPVEAGEDVLDLVPDPSCADAVIIATTSGLWRLKDGAEMPELLTSVPVRGHLLSAGSTLLGRDTGDTLWRYDIEMSVVSRQSVELPQDAWDEGELTWADDPSTGNVTAVSASGGLYQLCPQTMTFSSLLARVPLAPVTAMSATSDGRLFGTCGDGISKMFCFDPRVGSIEVIGVPVSVIGRRRYGYCFGAAVTGRDGHLIFGENDNSGHLWIYFPAITNDGTRHATAGSML